MSFEGVRLKEGFNIRRLEEVLGCSCGGRVVVFPLFPWWWWWCCGLWDSVLISLWCVARLILIFFIGNNGHLISPHQWMN